MPTIESLLCRNENLSLIAPAGYGKTEEIVKAVSVSEGKQLILTHTNAGVASLKSRLQKYKVQKSKYSIDTIASWLLKYSASYPQMSGLTEIHPTQDGWNLVYSSAKNLFQYRFIKEVLQKTYSGVFIDEYQDCTKAQHNLIVNLANFLPVKVLGDPLQGIFGFRNDPLINWDEDVTPIFKPLPELVEPWRWKNTNVKLGNWLIELRKFLLDNQKIDLSSYKEIDWFEHSIENEIDACYKSFKKIGSVVGIHMWPRDAHDSARRIGGLLQSMEEMECRALMEWSNNFDSNSGISLAINLIDFIFMCMVQEDFYNEIKKTISRNKINDLLLINDHEIGFAFFRIVENNDLSSIITILEKILHEKGHKIFRRELMIEMKRAIQAYTIENYDSILDAAWNIRSRTRSIGRKAPQKTISRTLLIKGLEFDHSIILNANQLQNKQHFYVASTRGSQSLTVLSRDPIIQF